MSLKEFNPELADKSRVLAISKCDMLDDELREEIAAEPPGRYPDSVHIGSDGAGLD